jgi:hypothetical protein
MPPLKESVAVSTVAAGNAQAKYPDSNTSASGRPVWFRSILNTGFCEKEVKKQPVNNRDGNKVRAHFLACKKQSIR